MKTKEKFTQKLLVEGSDDQHVVWALCKRFNIGETFDVIDSEGIENLFKQLPIRFKQANIETIGILIDADTNLQSRWRTLSVLLKKAGFNSPASFPDDGLILNSKEIGIKIGVWIMPNNKTNGNLEDLMHLLIPSDDKLITEVDSFLEEIEQKKVQKYKPKDKSKARIHSWLAAQEEPGTPLGLSITKKYLNPKHEISLLFVDWLNALFNP